MDGKSKWTAIVVACAIVLTLVAAYVGCYLGLAWTHTDTTISGTPQRPLIIRCYDRYWVAMLFLPASKIESAITRHDAQVTIKGVSSLSF
jgi:hypothetical protein